MRRAVNAAGFEVGISMDPAEAERLGIKPFGDGGAVEEGVVPKPKVYTHGPCGSPVGQQFVVNCEAWRAAGPESETHRSLVSQALAVLRAGGFVVLEKLHSPEDLVPLEAEAAWFLDTTHEGLVPQPLRASRTEGHLPFAVPWSSDWLMKNELVLEVVARYMHNNMAAGRTQDEQQWALVQWLTSGADLDWFEAPEWGPKPGELLDDPPPGCSDVGNAAETGPWFGRVSLIRTPPSSPPQKYHRDINFPGPTAQLTVQVPLTPLLANNGPLGYVPGSHCMKTPGYEVVANPPLGSVVLYDSFCEHRGIENHGSRDRYAIYYEFETRGVFSGYTASHFGPQSAFHMEAFRLAVDPALRHWVRQHQPQHRT